MSGLVRHQRRRCAYALFGLLFTLVCLSTSPSTSADAAFTEPVIRVEED